MFLLRKVEDFHKCHEFPLRSTMECMHKAVVWVRSRGTVVPLCSRHGSKIDTKFVLLTASEAANLEREMKVADVLGS